MKKMNILICTEFKVAKVQDHYFAEFVNYSIIIRYYEHLGNLKLCCRVLETESKPKDWIDITDIVEEFISVSLIDALMYKKNDRLEKSINECDLVVSRFPGFIPSMSASRARKAGKPVFSEVTACGWDGYWNLGLAGKLVAPYTFFGTKYALKKSDYALYVTNEFLQKRYPCKEKSIGVSNVVISEVREEVLSKRKKKIESMKENEIVLMTCAAVHVRYKGQQFVIKALPELNKRGIHARYYCVGQGSQDYLKCLAKKYNVEQQVVFTGSVSHDKIFELLDECDIYVQPSLQEGLPRAVIEAMSRGCPVIGARTGGIPELLLEDCVVKRKSSKNIADSIEYILNKGLKNYSTRNFDYAKQFQEVILNKKRNEYFKYVKEDLLQQ